MVLILSEPSLTDLWNEYNKIFSGGKRTGRALILEPLIHAEQKRIGVTPVYDFDKRWDKVAKDGASTVNGPPEPNSKPEIPNAPQRNFTVEQAKKIIGSGDCAILEDCAKVAEARMIFLADVLDKMNPSNSNVARRGQATNIAIQEFNRRKAE